MYCSRMKCLCILQRCNGFPCNNLDEFTQLVSGMSTLRDLRMNCPGVSGLLETLERQLLCLRKLDLTVDEPLIRGIHFRNLHTLVSISFMMSSLFRWSCRVRLPINYLLLVYIWKLTTSWFRFMPLVLRISISILHVIFIFWVNSIQFWFNKGFTANLELNQNCLNFLVFIPLSLNASPLFAIYSRNHRFRYWLIWLFEPLQTKNCPPLH